MNKPDHISETSEPFFRVKILRFFDADPGSGMENRIRDVKNSDPGSGIQDKHPGSRIRDKHPGTATLSFRRGDCVYQRGKLLKKLLSQLRPIIRPLVDKHLGFCYIFSAKPDKEALRVSLQQWTLDIPTQQQTSGRLLLLLTTWR